MAATETAIKPGALAHPRSGTALRRFYAPELDLLRLFAFSLVFLRHVVTGFGLARQQQQQVAAVAGTVVASTGAPAAGSPVLGPWALLQQFAQSLDFGVCLFFFLSAFLITRLLLLEKTATGTVNVKDFYIRRSLRIWPLYFVFLAVMAVASHFVPWFHITWPRMLASLLFVANWPVVLHGWIGSPIEPLWSVSVEEQFYVIWPQFARLGRRGVLLVSGVLVLVPVATLAYCGHGPHAENTAMWANSLVQCLFFAGGALMAALTGAEHGTRPGWQRVLLFLAGWVCWFTASAGCHVVRTISPATWSLMAGYYLVLAGTVLIFLSCAGWRPQRMPKSLLYLGKITYGLYVFHFLCLLLAERLTSMVLARLGTSHLPLLVVHGGIALLGLAATVGLAMLSYTLLEAPFLKFKKRFTVVASRPA